jgi:hypothetical protein
MLKIAILITSNKHFPISPTPLSSKTSLKVQKNKISTKSRSKLLVASQLLDKKKNLRFKAALSHKNIFRIRKMSLRLREDSRKQDKNSLMCNNSEGLEVRETVPKQKINICFEFV